MTGAGGSDCGRERTGFLRRLIAQAGLECSGVGIFCCRGGWQPLGLGIFGLHGATVCICRGVVPGSVVASERVHMVDSRAMNRTYFADREDAHVGLCCGSSPRGMDLLYVLMRRGVLGSVSTRPEWITRSKAEMPRSDGSVWCGDTD